jgi:hypothetical protein
MTHTQAASLASAAAEPTNLPRYCDRQDGAALVTERFFKVSSRTLEDWPVPSRLINGRAHYLTTELLVYARSVMEAAPQPRVGGRKAKLPPPAQTVSAA